MSLRKLLAVVCALSIVGTLTPPIRDAFAVSFAAVADVANSLAPTAVVPASQITGSLPAASVPNPSVSTLGGVNSHAAVAHQFLTQIGTDGSISGAAPTPADTGVLTGTTAAIGGGVLVAGACASGTATVTGVTTGMGLQVTPASDPTPDTSHGLSIYGVRTGANTVTVYVCAIVAATTPASVAYNVRATP